MLWTYQAHLDPGITVVCCGWMSRGVALGDGKVYAGQLDGKLVALDQRSGAVVWSVQAETNADGFSISNNFNLLGQITNTIDSAGTSVTNWFNNQGLRYAVSNAFGQLARAIFDVEDRPITNIDSSGVTISTTYDDLGRLLTRSYPDGGVETFGHSARGLIAYTNQIGNSNFYTYDEAAIRHACRRAGFHAVDILRLDHSGICYFVTARP